MHSCWASLVAASVGLGASPLSAQWVKEVGVAAIGTASSPALGVAGIYGAVRPSSRIRLSLFGGAGISDAKPAVRGELLAHFLLNPGQSRGVAVYGATGGAVVAGPVDQGYVVLAVGLEGAPASRTGWFVEGGVGGGVRVAVGFRRRWLSEQ